MKKRGYIFILVGILLILSPLYFVFKPKNCETAGCFEQAAADCKKAFILVDEAQKSISEYRILGKEKNNCVFEITVKEISTEFSASTQKQFEGKSMTCKMGTNEFSRLKFEDMGSNLDVCEGPLREAMYSAVIKKLYNLVVQDMSTILEEIGKTK